MKTGDTVRVGEHGGVGVAASTCTLVEFCDEPNTGLLIVEEVRDASPGHPYKFTVPYAWWDALTIASETRRALQNIVAEVDEQTNKALRHVPGEAVPTYFRDPEWVVLEDIRDMGRHALSSSAPGVSLHWKRRDPVDGDPIWIASLGPMTLYISVGCEWVWEWEIDSKSEGDLARGTVWVGENDTDYNEWDYQNVERAQKRCEAAARAMLPFLEPSALERYRAVEARLLNLRASTGQADPPGADKLLDELEALWSELPEPDRSQVGSEPAITWPSRSTETP